jgi:predicted SAM-dependent methyltransferase
MIKKLTKTIISIIGKHLKINLYGKAIKLEEAYYSSKLLNTIRCNTAPAVIKLKYKLRINNKKATLQLHLGCGDRHFERYINIDRRKTRATDLVCDIRKLPYPDNSVKLIETYHAIEHLPRHDLPKALKEWHRILMPGGKLIIECPNFDEIVKRYLEGEEEWLDGIFGFQRFPGDVHLFGYNFKRLENLLEEASFMNIQRREPQDYHAKEWPCIRVECVKG